MPSRKRRGYEKKQIKEERRTFLINREHAKPGEAKPRPLVFHHPPPEYRLETRGTSNEIRMLIDL